MTAHFTFTAREYRRALRGGRSWGRRLLFYPIVLAAPVAGVWAFSRVADSPSERVFLLVIWGVITLGALASPPLAWYLTARQALRDDRSAMGEQVRELSAAGLRVRGGGFDHMYEWGQLERLSETPEFFIFEFPQNDVHYLPKRALDGEQLDAVRELLAAHAPRAGKRHHFMPRELR